MPHFEGFPPETLTFLRELRLNNDRDWFQSHREEYERAYVEPARQFVTAAGEAIREFIPGIAAEPRISGSIFRINRDTRFSRDKRPYKDHLDFWFWEGPRKSAVSGLFMRVAPEFVGIGAGCHGFEKDRLELFRHALADQNSGSEFVQVVREIQSAGHEILGERFRREPPGYSVREEIRAYLRYGACYVHIDEPVDDRLHDGRILAAAVGYWRVLSPLHRWLTRHVQNG